MSLPTKLKKYLNLSTITMIISIIAALGIIIVSFIMLRGAENKPTLMIWNAVFMIAIGLANLSRAIVIDKQKSLMAIWGLATIIFIGGLIFTISTLG